MKSEWKLMVSGNEGDNRLSQIQEACKGKEEKSSTGQALADQLWGLFHSSSTPWIWQQLSHLTGNPCPDVRTVTWGTLDISQWWYLQFLVLSLPKA